MAEYTNDIDDKVDDEVFESIQPSNSRSFFLFAGAGSGKTRTLVNVLKRFKEEFEQEYKFKNKSIAIITYTNAAADEITHRLEYSAIFNVSTIHSFCWELIKTFTKDIKGWIIQNLNVEISELEEKQSRSRDLSNKSSISRTQKIESKKKRLEVLDNIQKFIYNPNGDNITKDSLNHSEVISITADFINNKELFRQILINRFPIVLIDESQDTKKELIDSLFDLQSSKEGEFTLGLFGDTMQRIYADGKENLGVALPESWAKPVKQMNHRSKSRIVELINKIRQDVDGQVQIPRIENEGGIVRFFIAPRTNDKTTVEKQIHQLMKVETDDEKWVNEDADVMTLTLEHHMAALRMGFSTFFNPLYAVNKLKTGLLDSSLASVNFFTKIILPLYNAHCNENKFEIALVIKKHSHLFSKEKILYEENKPNLLGSVNEKVNSFLSLWNENKHPSLAEILQKVKETELFKVPSTLKLVTQRIEISPEEGIKKDDSKDDDVLLAWDEAIKADFAEIINYNDYINEGLRFRTHQGVKGLEYDRVMVVIDDDESRGFMFSYDKLFGVKSFTVSDKKNIAAGKETGIDRTLRLFYVACSRAKESLAIVCYNDSPKELKRNIIEYGWFEENEIKIVE